MENLRGEEMNENEIFNRFITMISLKKCICRTLGLIVTNNLLFVCTYIYNQDAKCNYIVEEQTKKMARIGTLESMMLMGRKSNVSMMPSSRRGNHNVEDEPLGEIEAIIDRVLYGDNPREDPESENPRELNITEVPVDTLAHYPTGQALRSELFENKSGVHLPLAQFMHRNHCYLKVTKDYMQTAVNAFAIFLEGTVDDVLQLPALYVLQSARTISMMKIAREKLVATWTVIKGDHRADEITYQTLEMYRPLFKYINGREIAKLNLSDERILSYIGTHADLDRHQVGVVASKYIQLNNKWTSVKYLNLMNNLLCGVPMLYMRTLGENTYLQLSHQIFYHIRSCDPLQRRFFLHIMSRTQVLGKSNSWSAGDVARLGLLLTEVDAPELCAINPQAMSGITAQVMMEMAPQNLKYLTETQLKYIAHKPMNILAKKLHGYQDELLILNSNANTGFKASFSWNRIIMTLTLQQSCSVLPYIYYIYFRA